MAGKAFDRFGGRWPLVRGYLVLAAKGIVLAVSVSSGSAVALIPGPLLQGLGLGIVLTVNDPTGLTAVPDKDSGEAAGMINTSEQHLPHSQILDLIKPDVIASHVTAFEATFFASAGIALLGAIVTFVFVRKNDRLKTPGPGVFSRRSRWIATSVGRSPAISRRPAPRPGESATG